MLTNIRVSGRGIVVHEGRVLLNHFEKGGYYNIPGGGVEPGETAKEATEREIYEESGLRVKACGFMFFFDYEPVRNEYTYGDIPHMSTVFRCEPEGKAEADEAKLPDVDPFDPDNIGKAVWVDIDDIPNIHLVPDINEILYRILGRGTCESVYLEL